MNDCGAKTLWVNVTSYKWKLTNWRLLRYLYASNSDKITLNRQIRGRCCFIFDSIVVIEHLLIQSFQNGCPSLVTPSQLWIWRQLLANENNCYIQIALEYTVTIVSSDDDANDDIIPLYDPKKILGRIKTAFIKQFSSFTPKMRTWVKSVNYNLTANAPLRDLKKYFKLLDPSTLCYSWY